MAKYEIEIEGIPDGYEPVRFGLPRNGESYLNTISDPVRVADHDYVHALNLILRKVKRWRKPALPDDAKKACRVSDDGTTWEHCHKVVGWIDDSYQWITSMGNRYKYCEVEE